MTAFYLDDRVVVTSETVEVDGRTYLLEDLAGVRHDGRLRAAWAWVLWFVRRLAGMALVLLVFPGLVVAIAITWRQVFDPEGIDRLDDDG